MVTRKDLAEIIVSKIRGDTISSKKGYLMFHGEGTLCTPSPLPSPPSPPTPHPPQTSLSSTVAVNHPQADSPCRYFDTQICRCKFPRRYFSIDFHLAEYVDSIFTRQQKQKQITLNTKWKPDPNNCNC